MRWVKWLEGRGHEVALFSLVKGAGASHFGPEPPLDRRYLFTFGSAVRRTASLLRKMLDDFDPQVVHGFYLVNHGHYAVGAGRHPMVVTAMGSDVLLAPNKSWLLSRIVKRTARGADRVVAVAPHLAERLEKWGVPSPRLSIISLGVDSSLFKPGSKELLVLYSRGFNEIYDPLTLAYSLPQVVEQVPMVRFVLSGSGPLKKKVEALVAKMGLLDKVGLPGNISPQSMAGLTARARVMVSPSLSDGTPISVLEGLSSGCVLVASEIDGNRRWVVPGKNGLLFPPGDPDALAEALVQALTDDSLAERALRKGPQMIKADGDWHINSERVERLYFDIVGA